MEHMGYILGHSCNKYCNLIGHCRYLCNRTPRSLIESLQDFDRTPTILYPHYSVYHYDLNLLDTA